MPENLAPMRYKILEEQSQRLACVVLYLSGMFPTSSSITETERHDAEELARVLHRRIKAENQKVAGFNLGSNCGQAAGQTISHANIHLIPRRNGDMPDPRGGVRGVIPEKRIY
jgi:diadenosine tetraphosphate (Ap4A) HIT family hydrolase